MERNLPTFNLSYAEEYDIPYNEFCLAVGQNLFI